MIARALGLVAYEPTWRAMQAFNAARNEETPDQLWLVEHPPVFTLGLAGRPEHVLAPRGIPVVKTDRGGQVTYHGPGQAVAYALVDLRRARLGVRQFVRQLEEAVIATLAEYGIDGRRREGMPGVYVDNAKIAAVGLRVARGCSYHGVALNATVDLEPFERIDPCGYAGLASTRTADLGVRDSMEMVQGRLAENLRKCLIPT
ncbi:MAG TPA: lipoyl(octanoyl) transferase LipB [Usitatibacter sp.]|nr:lipoyl(octanoyl) transferase LipB [Usitatibacter sp.]